MRVCAVLLAMVTTTVICLDSTKSDHINNTIEGPTKSKPTSVAATKNSMESDEDDDNYDDEDDNYDDDDDYYYDEDYDEDDEDVDDMLDSSGCPVAFHGRCVCGMAKYLKEKKYVVNCTNTGFTNASMLEYLPEETEVLIFTGNFIEVLPTNVFGTVSHFENLETIDMSNNGIKEVKGKTYHRVSNVKTLILNHNDLSIVKSKHHPRVFSNFRNLESLHLTNTFSDALDSLWYLVNLELIFHGSQLTKLKKLHLEQNEIRALRNKHIFCRLPGLEQLYLGSNRMSGVDFELGCVANITYLDLEYNSIQQLDVNSTDQLDRLTARNPRFSIKLTGNPFSCECSIRPFFQWLQTTRTRIEDRARYRCFEAISPELENLPLDQLSREALNCDSSAAAEAGSGGAVASTLLAFLLMFLFALLIGVSYVYSHQWMGRAKTLRPQLRDALRSVRRSRQYRNLQQPGDPPPTDV